MHCIRVYWSGQLSAPLRDGLSPPSCPSVWHMPTAHMLSRGCPRHRQRVRAAVRHPPAAPANVRLPLQVLDAGVSTTVQDFPGRTKLWSVGVCSLPIWAPVTDPRGAWEQATAGHVPLCLLHAM